jgi:hypothetical protein
MQNNLAFSLPVPGENGMVGFKGSAFFIPGPVLRNTILISNTKDPFKLIPLMTGTSREFDLAQPENSTILQGNAITDSDDLNTWLFGMKVGLINETTVIPNNVKVLTFCNNQHLQFITLNTTMTTAAGEVTLDNALLISQLTNAVSIQNKEAIKSNNFCHKDIERQIEREEKKKEQTKKIHPAIINMLRRVAATHKNEETEENYNMCLRFINAENIKLVQ